MSLPDIEKYDLGPFREFIILNRMDSPAGRWLRTRDKYAACMIFCIREPGLYTCLKSRYTTVQENHKLYSREEVMNILGKLSKEAKKEKLKQLARKPSIWDQFND